MQAERVCSMWNIETLKKRENVPKMSHSIRIVEEEKTHDSLSEMVFYAKGRKSTTFMRNAWTYQYIT